MSVAREACSVAVPSRSLRGLAAESRAPRRALRPSRLEAVLRPLGGYRGRVFTRQAGAAELGRGPARRCLQPCQRQVRERGCADVLPDLLDRLVGRNQLVGIWVVDAVVTL